MIELRGHHLLCLPRFNGLGYNEQFIANMADISRSLAENPTQVVRVTSSPDSICRACPHLNHHGCSLDDEGKKAADRDRQVLMLLGLSDGAVAPYSILAAKLADVLQNVALSVICKDCRWLETCLRFVEAPG